MMTSFEELIDLMREHLEPKQSVLSERHQFLKFIAQETSESVGNFMTRVKDCAERCEYDANMYEMMVRDIFISGLKEQFRKILLTSEGEKMTSKDALAKAQIEEQALRGNEAMNPVASVNAVRGQKPSGGQKKHYSREEKFRLFRCKTCTLRGHEADECTVECFVCDEKGHISRNCPTKTKGKKKKSNDNKSNKKAHMVEEESSESAGEEYEFDMCHVAMRSCVNLDKIDLIDSVINDDKVSNCETVSHEKVTCGEVSLEVSCETVSTYGVSVRDCVSLCMSAFALV